VGDERDTGHAASIGRPSRYAAPIAHADTLYDRVGGLAFFVALVERFYEGVEADPILRPLYPSDLDPGKRNLAEFLAQYWGGPPAYNERRGHPRLRMRHFAFAIGPRERDAWVEHMTAAVRAGAAAPADADELLTYFRDASTMLVNRPA
jgi:hemoglobin